MQNDKITKNNEYTHLRKRIEAGIQSGNIQLPQNIGTPSSYEFLRVVNSVPVTTFFQDRSEVSQTFSYLDSRVKSFFDAFSRFDFHQGKTGLDLKVDYDIARSKEDLKEPRLAGILEDNRVIVKAVKSHGDLYLCEVKFTFPGLPDATCGIQMFLPSGFSFVRGYDYSCDIRDGNATLRLTPERMPVSLVTLYGDSPELYFSLFSDLLRNRLEPITTRQILKKIKSDEGNLKNNHFLDRAAVVSLKEEELVASAIMKSAMSTINVRGRKLFSGSKILSLVDFSTDPVVATKALESVDNQGVQKTIDFYASNSWNLDEFLDGSFIKRFQGR